MLIERFEDVIAWQKARELTISVYKQFKECKDYCFRDQICRAAVSIMNNIAEGFERQTKKELKQFLFIAKGSCAEVRSMLHLANDFMYISPNQYKPLQNSSIETTKILSGLIKTL